MSYLTKDQLNNYLSNLPSDTGSSTGSSEEKFKKTEYASLKNDLIFPMNKMSLNNQQAQNDEQIDHGTIGSIRDRMKRLNDATGIVLNSVESQTPAFPQTPKPVIPSKPSFSSTNTNNNMGKMDAFEASLMPRLVNQNSTASFSRGSAAPASPVATAKTVTIPPPLPPPLNSSSPPAVPNSPRPPKPTKLNANRNSTPAPTSKNESKVSVLSPIYAGLKCPACHKDISGSVVSAMDTVWHANCFKCAKCHKILENEQFFEKDELPYCRKDYQNLFSLRCDFCHEPIEGSAINALGKSYHEGHFCCKICHKPFDDHSPFMIHEEQPYCQDDYLKVCGKKCSGCNEYISGEYINALGQEWHKGCFSCTDCKRPFSGGSFLVRDNKPYCEEHYHHSLQQPQKSPQQKASLPILKPKPPAIAKKPKFALPDTELSAAPAVRKTASVNTATNSRVSESSAKPKGSEETVSSKVCHRCCSVIDGPSASAFGYEYHISHFKCYNCERALSSRVPGMWQEGKNSELVCKMCAIKQSKA